jgi:hypothetical protein
MPPDQSEADLKSRDFGGAALEALASRLAALPAFDGVRSDDLAPMRTRGLMHAHVLLRGRGQVLRIPRAGSFGMGPVANLAYQSACFDRAFPSGHVPKRFAALEPSPEIPWGALVIEAISGDMPQLPADLGAVAEALAALHALPVPDVADRPPLLFHGDPVGATVAVIAAQAAYLDRAGVGEDSRRQIDEEIGWARGFAGRSAGTEQPVALVGTDTHPGNFLVPRPGRAVFVDLEKMLYGSPAIDLAHASVYTSTMWDPEAATALADADVAAFYETYFAAVGPAAADRLRPWCLPLRRLTWLRTTTWCAKWRVESRDGAEWSAASHDPDYIAKVRARIADYFDPQTIARIRAGFSAL